MNTIKNSSAYINHKLCIINTKTKEKDFAVIGCICIKEFENKQMSKDYNAIVKRNKINATDGILYCTNCGVAISYRTLLNHPEALKEERHVKCKQRDNFCSAKSQKNKEQKLGITKKIMKERRKNKLKNTLFEALTFGKYKGKTLLYVYKHNKGYLKWMLENKVAFISEIKLIFKNEKRITILN